MYFYKNMKIRLFYTIILYVFLIDGDFVVEGVRNVKIGEYPYMAYIYYPHESKLKLEYRRFLEAAVLVTPEFLLSSEIDLEYHGGFPANTLLARLGTVTIEPNIGPPHNENEQEREIFELIKPLENWWKREMNMMRTALPFETNLIVKPTPITTRKVNLEQRTCHVLIFSQFENGGDDKFLMRLDVMMLVSDVESCGKKFEERQMTCGRYKENITSVIDADFCQDNAGGPLICDGEVMGLQAYFDTDDCKSPYFYQMFWAWDNFITCGTQGCIGNCNKICTSKFRETADDNIHESITLVSTDGLGQREPLGGEDKSLSQKLNEFSNGQEAEIVKDIHVYHTRENENKTLQKDSAPHSNGNNTPINGKLSTNNISISSNTKNEDYDSVDRFIQSKKFEKISNIDKTSIEKAKTKSDHEKDHREINSYLLQTENGNGVTQKEINISQNKKAISKNENDENVSTYTENKLQEHEESNETQIYVPPRAKENMQINDNIAYISEQKKNKFESSIVPKEADDLEIENVDSNGNNASGEIKNKIENEVYRTEKEFDILKNIKPIFNEDINNLAVRPVKTASKIGSIEKEIDEAANTKEMSKDDGDNALDKIKDNTINKPDIPNFSASKKGTSEEDNENSFSEQFKNELERGNIEKENVILKNEKVSPTLYNDSNYLETEGEKNTLVKESGFTGNKSSVSKDNDFSDQIIFETKNSIIEKEIDVLESEMGTSKKETDHSDVDETKDKSQSDENAKESEDSVNKINSENEGKTTDIIENESEQEKEHPQRSDKDTTSNNTNKELESETDSIKEKKDLSETVEEAPIGAIKHETLDEAKNKFENDNSEVSKQTDIPKNEKESSREGNDYNNSEISKDEAKKAKSSSKEKLFPNLEMPKIEVLEPVNNISFSINRTSDGDTYSENDETNNKTVYSKLYNTQKSSGSEFTESYESNSSNIIVEVTNVVIKTVEDLLNVHKNHASRTTIDLNETIITPKPKMAKMGRVMADHAGSRTQHKLFSFLFLGTFFDVAFVILF